MKVRELIKILIDRPMDDYVVYSTPSNKRSKNGAWTEIEEDDVRIGQGITIIRFDTEKDSE